MRRRQHGFTLLEMAITLAIAGILLSGLIITLGAQQDASREAETRRYLVQAKEALYGFAMSNGRLPCPANPGTAAGAAGAGVERARVGGVCQGGAAGLNGVLPWATLGLAETDAYGGRISYRVTSEFARDVGAGPFACVAPPATAPTQSAFALCTPGDMTVNALGGATALATVVPAVLVSHGPNRAGGFNSGGVQSPAGGADESENSNGDNVFRAGARREVGAAGGEFDDQVDWIVPSILMHRMVQAGRLP